MGSHDPLVRIFPQLSKMDMRSPDTIFLMIGLSFVTCMAVFIASYIVSLFFVTFRSYLRTKEKVFWCLAFVRAVFGFVAAAFGIWGLAFTDILHKDVVNGSTETSFIAVYVCTGYFLFECIALFGSNIYFRTFDVFLFAHHSLSLLGFSVVVYYGNTHFFAVVGMLLEITTPFSCFCWMLLKAKMAKLFVWKANQFLLVHLFHCRTTLEGFFYYMSYMQWENISNNMPGLVMFFLYTQLTVQFFLLTPYWTYKKMMQLFNPVDWNHPELQGSKSVTNQAMNGHSSVRPKTE